jgi:hypothetical protein
MDFLNRSPLITETNLENYECNNFISKTPNYNFKMYYDYFHNPCSCLCHCHSRAHNLLHNISCSRIDFQDYSKLYTENKYHLYPKANKSTSNIFISQNNNLFDDNLRQRCDKNYNKRTIFHYKRKKDYQNDYNNKKKELSRTHSYPNIQIKNNSKNENSNDDIYNNYNFKSVKIKGGNMHNSYNNNIGINDANQSILLKKYNIKPLKSFQIKRKKLSQYYHISNPKKYSYGGKKLQTVNSTNNHKYKEVTGTSVSKENEMKKSRVINFNELKNKDNDINMSNDKIKIEINNDTSNSNVKNHKFLNTRYMSYQNSPKNISRNLSYEPTEKKSELNQRILKETYNTRLFESKNLKNSKGNINLNDISNEKDYKYNFNNIKNGLNIGTSDYLYRNGNKNNINKIPNSININNNKNDNYNYYGVKTYDNNLKNMPKSYSVSNLDNYEDNISYNLKNRYKRAYDNNFSNDYNQNNNNDANVDYEMIKLKVKLALLRKQMYEQEKERIFNDQMNLMNADYYNKNKKYLENFLSTENQRPRVLNDNSLILKTKKLLEEKRLRNKQRELIKNMNNNENKILYSLKKNLRDKNSEYNKNSIIKPRLKVWKP